MELVSQYSWQCWSHGQACFLQWLCSIWHRGDQPRSRKRGAPTMQRFGWYSPPSAADKMIERQ